MSIPTPTSSARGRRRTLLQNQFALISSIVENEGNKQLKAKSPDNNESVLSMIDQTLRINEVHRQAEPQESQLPATEKGMKRGQDQESSVELLQSMIDQTLRINEVHRQAEQRESQQPATEEEPQESQQPATEEEPQESQQPATEKEPQESQQPAAEEEPQESQQPATEQEVEKSESQESSVVLLQSLRSKLSATVGSEGSEKAYTIDELRSVFDQKWHETPLEGYATQLGYRSVRRLLKGDEVAEIISSEVRPDGTTLLRAKGTGKSERLLSMSDQTPRIKEGCRQAEPQESQQPATEQKVKGIESQESSVQLLQSLRSKLSATVGSEGSVKTYTFKELQAAFNQDWRRTPLEGYATQLGYKSVRRLLKGDEVAEIISREVGPDGKSRLRAKGTDKSERVLSMIDQTLRIKEGRRQARQRESQQRVQTNRFRRTQ